MHGVGILKTSTHVIAFFSPDIGVIYDFNYMYTCNGFFPIYHSYVISSSTCKHVIGKFGTYHLVR